VYDLALMEISEYKIGYKKVQEGDGCAVLSICAYHDKMHRLLVTYESSVCVFSINKDQTLYRSKPDPAKGPILAAEWLSETTMLFGF
jgi:hypothetical protein